MRCTWPLADPNLVPWSEGPFFMPESFTVVGAFFKRVCSGHTAAPASPLGRLRSWLCCHPGKNPVVPSYVPEACQSCTGGTGTAWYAGRKTAPLPPHCRIGAGARSLCLRVLSQRHPSFVAQPAACCLQHHLEILTSLAEHPKRVDPKVVPHLIHRFSRAAASTMRSVRLGQRRLQVRYCEAIRSV